MIADPRDRGAIATLSCGHPNNAMAQIIVSRR